MQRPEDRHSGPIVLGFMTFLNPFVLFGLAAAAIPLILHLLNLRKLRTVEFSSIRFLQELQKTRIRRLRIRQLLLLLIRTLLIVFLVLAFARPALRGSAAEFVGGRAATTMIVMLDDSPSMAIRNQTGELFPEARRIALRLLEMVRPGDQVFLLPLSSVRHEDPISPVATGTMWEDLVGRIERGSERVPYLDAVRTADRLAAASTNANKEFYLITDGQATQFRLPAERGDTTLHPDPRLKAFLLEIPHRPPDNAGIGEVTVLSQILARNKPLHLRATVQNPGGSAIQNSVVSAYLGGSRVAQATVTIPASASASVDFTIVPKTSGVLDGHIQIEEDALPDDNRRFFILDIPDSVSVLLIGGNQRDTRLVSIALLPSGDSSFTGLFRVRTATEPQLPSVDFAAADVVVLCGLHDFSSVEADRIGQFVRAGGGLMVFPGPASDIANYNTMLFPKLGIPPATPPVAGSSVDTAGTESGMLSFDRIDLSHPLFADLFERPEGRPRSRPTIESPAIRRSIDMAAGPRGRTIIGLPNGHGFLNEYRDGDGRVFLCAVDAGLAWSDFAVKGIFAPLLHRSMLYLSATGKPAVSSTTGATIEFNPRLRHPGPDETFIVRSPSGIETRVVPRHSSVSGLTTVSFPDAREPGVYELVRGPGSTGRMQGGRRIFAVAVNVDPAESDLRLADDATLKEFWQRTGIEQDRIHQLSTTDPLTSEVLQSRFGVELWRYFILLAVLMAFTEMIVGRARKSEAREESA